MQENGNETVISVDTANDKAVCLPYGQPPGAPCWQDVHCDTICNYNTQQCAYAGTLGSLCHMDQAPQCQLPLMCWNGQCHEILENDEECSHDFQCASRWCTVQQSGDSNARCRTDNRAFIGMVVGSRLGSVAVCAICFYCFCCVAIAPIAPAASRHRQRRQIRRASARAQQEGCIGDLDISSPPSSRRVAFATEEINV